MKLLWQSAIETGAMIGSKIRDILAKYNYSISQSSVARFIASREVDLVFDVGANVGQFARRLRSQGYRGKIVSFEPVDEVFQKLSANMASDSNWEGRKLALGNEQGQQTIHVSRASEFNSLLSINSYAGKFYNDYAATTRDETIQVDRLDTIFHQFSGNNIFLKIDTQGYEENVLKGATVALTAIVGVQLELPLRQLYSGNWDMISALKKMDELGFIPAQMYPVSRIREDSQSWTEVDCVFRRKQQHDF